MARVLHDKPRPLMTLWAASNGRRSVPIMTKKICYILLCRAEFNNMLKAEENIQRFFLNLPLLWNLHYTKYHVTIWEDGDHAVHISVFHS